MSIVTSIVKVTACFDLNTAIIVYHNVQYFGEPKCDKNPNKKSSTIHFLTK